MQPPRSPAPLLASRGLEGRRHGRLHTELLTCNLGVVIDLSASGMRVACHGRMRVQKDQALAMEVCSVRGRLALKTRVIWTRKTGFFRYQVGLEFTEMTPALQVELREIARLAVKSLVMSRGDDNAA